MARHLNIISIREQLEIPLAVHDILSGADRMSDETCYGLHAAISDMKPHEALLCMALCTRTVLSYCKPSEGAVRAAKAECDAIVERTADLYMAGQKNEVDVITHLPAVADDLQSMHVRLKYLADIIGEKNALACIFCDIFSVQAHAQKMVADEFIELYENFSIAKANEVTLHSCQ